MKKQTAIEFLVRFPEVLGKSDTTSSQEPILIKSDMTPKEKAEELIDKFRNEITSFLGDNMKKINAKKCALVAVDELIKIHYLLTATHDTSPSINYWKEVKKELEKL
jgi:hypothetical protein